MCRGVKVAPAPAHILSHPGGTVVVMTSKMARRFSDMLIAPFPSRAQTETDASQVSLTLSRSQSSLEGVREFQRKHSLKFAYPEKPSRIYPAPPNNSLETY
jgi:hypothetical protein